MDVYRLKNELQNTIDAHEKEKERLQEIHNGEVQALTEQVTKIEKNYLETEKANKEMELDLRQQISDLKETLIQKNSEYNAEINIKDARIADLMKELNDSNDRIV